MPESPEQKARREIDANLAAAVWIVQGIRDLVAQMIGHSSPSIVQTYAKAIDEHKRDAIRKLESLRPEPQLSASTPGRQTRPLGGEVAVSGGGASAPLFTPKIQRP